MTDFLVYRAIEHECIESIKLLINKGAKFNGTGAYNPMYSAIKKQNIEIIKLLIDVGVDLNQTCYHEEDTYTLLHFAIEIQNINIIRLLIESKINIDIDKKDNHGNTVFDLAGHYSDESSETTEIFKLLIKKYIIIDGKINSNFNCDIIHSCMSVLSHIQNYEILKWLLENGFNNYINNQNKFGHTVLHYASYDNALEIVELLLENGARVDILNDDGNSPLDLTSDDEIKELLLENQNNYLLK